MTLSVCMIVRDEEAVLARCLDGIKDIADEIIIVDTGSADTTAAIAAKYTDKVYFFKWTDDFSAARNYSFSLAGGDYVMWLDADDVVTEENAAAIRALVDGGGFDAAYLKYAARTDGEVSFVYFRERIFLRSLSPLWEGAVHEAITPRGRLVWSDAVIFHEKVRENAPLRNLRIYQGKIARGEKLSPREKFYYGRELFFNSMPRECIAVLSDYLGGDGWVENRVEACRTMYRAYMSLGDERSALNCIFAAFALSYPRAEECCALGGYFLGKEQFAPAIYWFERALASRERAEDGGFVSIDCLGYIPAINLAVIYDRMGDYARANEYNELAGSFRPNDAAYLSNKRYFGDRLARPSAAPQPPDNLSD